MFEAMGIKAMKEGAERLQRYMASVDSDLKQLGEAFNQNFKSVQEKLTSIEAKLESIEAKLSEKKE